MTNLALLKFGMSILYTAICDNECIEDDELLSNILFIVEQKTGVTLEQLKSYVKEPYTELDEESVAFDAQNMSIKELGDKYNLSKTTMWSYLQKHKIKTNQNQINLEQLSEELKIYQGKYTISQLTHLTNHSYYIIKKCCNEYNIPYAEAVC